METQLTQDKNPVPKPEEQVSTPPPVEQPANGPATMPLAPEKGGEEEGRRIVMTDDLGAGTTEAPVPAPPFWRTRRGAAVRC